MESFQKLSAQKLSARKLPAKVTLPCLLGLSVILAACGGGSSSPGSETPRTPTELPNTPDQPGNPGSPGLSVDIADVYDATQVAAPKAPATNVIANPSFEEGSNNWTLCQTVSIVNDPNAPDGNSVVHIRNQDSADDISRGCDGDYDIVNSLETPITLDPNATYYTLSFKARTSESLGSRAYSWIRVMIDDESNLGADYPNGLNIGYTPQQIDAWTHFKYVFTKAELDEALAINGAPNYDNLQLLFDVRNVTDTSVYIDDIRLVNEYETLYPQTTMPQDLRDNNERILIADMTESGGKLATMTVGGRNLSHLESVDIQFASGSLYTNNTTFIGSEETLTPAGNTNSLVTPANSFRTWTYDFSSGQVNEFPITYTGTPGQAFSDLSRDEELALTFAPGRISVSPGSDRLAIEVGSANLNNARSIVGSPASFVELYNLQGTTKVASIPGNFGVLSADGKLAIADHDSLNKENNITIADKDGNIDDTRSFAFNALDMVWSPDNNQVAMIISPGLNNYYNGQSSDENVGRYTGIYIFNYNERTLSNPLILENGLDMKGMHWTNDGKYILYTTRISSDDGQTSNDRYEIRWLNPTTGDIGVVTHNISAIISSE